MKITEEKTQKYEITVLILTYNASLNKLILTIKSALLQKNVNLQIVISDDGSSINHNNDIVKYFENNKFKEYRILNRDKNEGTVASIYEAITLCDGKYIKLISPGDYLHGYYALRNWIDFMCDNKLSLSYADSIYYQWKDNMIKPIRVKINPQRTDNGIVGCIHQLVYDDIWLGASILTETILVKEYINKIYSSVKFAEDHIYRFMTYSGETYDFFPSKTVLYEYGTGISTKGQDIWTDRLKKDWDAADKILSNEICYNEKLNRMVMTRLKMKEIDSGINKRIFGFIHIPGYYFYYIKLKIRPRYSSVVLDEEYIKDLLYEL